MKLFVRYQKSMRPRMWGVLLGLACGGAACSHAKLDDSFGTRNRDIFRVQTAARNSRDVVTHGQEAEAAVAKYFSSIAPDESGGSKGAPSASGPLKIPGLSH